MSSADGHGRMVFKQPATQAIPAKSLYSQISVNILMIQFYVSRKIYYEVFSKIPLQIEFYLNSKK